FDLPPLDEQKRIADLLWALEWHRQALRNQTTALSAARSDFREWLFRSAGTLTSASRAFSITIGRQRSPKHATGPHLVPYLRSANVTGTGIDIEDVKEMNFTPAEQDKFKLQDGDVLVSEASASPGSVGMPATWRGELPGVVCFQNTLLRFRAVPHVSLAGIVEEWCHWAFESGQFLSAASGTNIRHIGVGGASSMEVRLPDVKRQTELLDDLLSFTDAAERLATYARSLDAVSGSLRNEIFGGHQ
ncbi:MAG: hypothetical protein ACP5H2_09940, partial [Solirubrobacteraceae bacterium]